MDYQIKDIIKFIIYRYKLKINKHILKVALTANSLNWDNKIFDFLYLLNGINNCNKFIKEKDH